MICTKCGARLAPGARSCERCGAANEQPSREAIRARVQGGGRSAASGAAPGADVGSYALVGLGISLLQILLLFLKGAVKVPDVWTEQVERISLFRASPWLALLLLLLCLLSLGWAVLPLLGMELPRRRTAAILLALATLLVGIAALTAGVRANTVRDPFFGSNEIISKASIGAAGVLFLLLSAASALTAWLSGRTASRPQSRRSVTAPRHSPPAPAEKARQESPRPRVTPPDAETIAALRKMAQMYRQGLISEEEFARIKAECVARGWIRE